MSGEIDFGFYISPWRQIYTSLYSFPSESFLNISNDDDVEEEETFATIFSLMIYLGL